MLVHTLICVHARVRRNWALDFFRYFCPVLLYTYPETAQVGPMFKVMKWVYRNFEAPGAALPSSHMAGAICTVYFSFRYLRRIRYLHLLVAMLLCMSTVYCRYHYVVDVIAGLLTAAVVIPIGNWLYFKFAQTGAASQPGPVDRSPDPHLPARTAG